MTNKASGPSYQTHDPKGWCGDPLRGAALGRHTYHGELVGKLTVREIPLDGDYDPNGTYFGGGEGSQPIYWYASDDCEVDGIVRAKDRDDAIAQVREFYPAAEFKPLDPILDGLDVMLAAYIAAALWSSTDEADESGGEPLDANYGAEDLEPDALAKMTADCTAFLTANAADIGSEFSDAGNDFWLTRNGHGCGFWDGDWPKEAGKRLTDAAHWFGEVNLYVGDDGKLYH